MSYSRELQAKVKKLDDTFGSGHQNIEAFCRRLAMNEALLARLLEDELFNRFIENNKNKNDLFLASLEHLLYQLDRSLITYENVMKMMLVAELSMKAHEKNNQITVNFEHQHNSHFALRPPGQPALTSANKKKLDDALDTQWQDIRNTQGFTHLPAKIPNDAGVLAMLNELNPPKQRHEQVPRRNERAEAHIAHDDSTRIIRNGINHARPAAQAMHQNANNARQQPAEAQVRREPVEVQRQVNENVQNVHARQESEVFAINTRGEENKPNAGYIFKYDQNNQLIRSNNRHRFPSKNGEKAHAAYVTDAGTLKSGMHFSSSLVSIFLYDQNLKKTDEINIKGIMSAKELDNGWLACCDRIGRLYLINPKEPKKVYEYDDGEPKFKEGENRLTKLRVEGGKLIQSSNTRSKEFDLNTLMTGKKAFVERSETDVREQEEAANRNRNRYR